MYRYFEIHLPNGSVVWYPEVTEVFMVARSSASFVVASPSTLTPRSLQVSGLECFEERGWRECVLYYLFGVWSGAENVVYRPKINFGEITLRLNVGEGRYYAHGTPVELEYPYFLATETLVVENGQRDVEIGLVRFVKNNRIKMLVIKLSEGSELRLWKKSERSRFGITATGLKTMMELCTGS